MVKYEVLEPRRIKNHPLKKFAGEWRNDPSGPADLAQIRRSKWRVKSMNLKEILLGPDVVTDREFMRRLQKRVQAQIALIQEGTAIPPLVIIGKKHILIDGYARYFALKKLGIHEAVTYHGAEKA